jgi:phosphosulfolactate phosphohydrolase-like enzyme
LGLESGTKIVLPSLNGATCSRLSRAVPYLFAGALVNAEVVAAAVSQVLSTTDLSVTIIACGEQWFIPSEEEQLRVAIEDYLGAGAIYRIWSMRSHLKLVFVRVLSSLFKTIWRKSFGIVEVGGNCERQDLKLMCGMPCN